MKNWKFNRFINASSIFKISYIIVSIIKSLFFSFGLSFVNLCVFPPFLSLISTDFVALVALFVFVLPMCANSSLPLFSSSSNDVPLFMCTTSFPLLCPVTSNVAPLGSPPLSVTGGGNGDTKDEGEKLFVTKDELGVISTGDEENLLSSFGASSIWLDLIVLGGL